MISSSWVIHAGLLPSLPDFLHLSLKICQLCSVSLSLREVSQKILLISLLMPGMVCLELATISTANLWLLPNVSRGPAFFYPTDGLFFQFTLPQVPQESMVGGGVKSLFWSNVCHCLHTYAFPYRSVLPTHRVWGPFTCRLLNLLSHFCKHVWLSSIIHTEITFCSWRLHKVTEVFS